MTYERPQKDKSKNVARDAANVENTRKNHTFTPADARKRHSAGTRSDIRSFTLEEENVQVVAAVKEAPKVREVKARKKMPFPTSVVFVTIICTVLFMFMMLTLAQINEFTQDISALQNQLSELEKQEEDLRVEVELKYDLSYIEDIALNELGMVKSDTLNKTYVHSNNEDKIEVYEPETEKQGLFSSVMSAIGTNFRDLWEYLK